MSNWMARDVFGEEKDVTTSKRRFVRARQWGLAALICFLGAIWVPGSTPGDTGQSWLGDRLFWTAFAFAIVSITYAVTGGAAYMEED